MSKLSPVVAVHCPNGTLAYLLFRSLTILNHHSAADSWPLRGLYSARVAVTEAGSLLCTFWNPRSAFSASVLPLAPNSRPQQYARFCQLPLSWQWAATLHHEAYRRWPRGWWALLHTLPWIPGRTRAHSQREAHQQAAARVCHHGPSDRQQIRWVPCCRDCNPSFVVWNITLRAMHWEYLFLRHALMLVSVNILITTPFPDSHLSGQLSKCSCWEVFTAFHGDQGEQASAPMPKKAAGVVL